jgi:hypothetical protein
MRMRNRQSSKLSHKSACYILQRLDIFITLTEADMKHLIIFKFMLL